MIMELYQFKTKYDVYLLHNQIANIMWLCRKGKEIINNVPSQGTIVPIFFSSSQLHRAGVTCKLMFSCTINVIGILGSGNTNLFTADDEGTLASCT